MGWERFGWESCRARFDLVLARPCLLRDLERLRNMLDWPPPPPPRPRPPLGVSLESSSVSWDLLCSTPRPGLDLLPDLELPRPRGLPELLLSLCSRARLDVVLARLERDLLRDLEPPKRFG